MKLILVLMLTVGIMVNPSFCLAPCKVKVTVRMPPDVKEGEWVCLTLTDEFERRSCWPHTGRMVTDIHIKDIPEGIYTVGVRTDKMSAQARLEVH